MKTNETHMDWFNDAKFGIFIHWGIYAVNGKDASWSYFNHEQPWARPEHHSAPEEYFAQCEHFTAAAYNPDAWAETFRSVGARYVVITTKHCDDFALWATQQKGGRNVVDDTPAGRDLIAPLCAALRRVGLKVGLYYSHSGWGHPDYPTLYKDPTQRGQAGLSKYAYPQNGSDENPAAWARYLAYQRGQIRELCETFQPDLLWFDADWERTPEQWGASELIALIRQWCPHVVLNNRTCHLGDYSTPEQGLPTRIPEGPWELCLTIDRQWGYTEFENDLKSSRQLLWFLIHTATKGGNLLLNVSPRADGTLPAEHTDRLREIGAWLERHGAALFGTTLGLPDGLFEGASTLSLDRQTLYLITSSGGCESLAVQGVHAPVTRVEHLATGTTLPHRFIAGAEWANLPGVLWVDLPVELRDPLYSVVCVHLAKPLEIYHGTGQVLSQAGG